MKTKISPLDFYCAGFSRMQIFETSKPLAILKGPLSTQTGFLGSGSDRSDWSHTERVSDGFFRFDVLGETISDVELEAAISTAKFELERRHFKAKGHLEFVMYFFRDDEDHYFVGVDDCYEGPQTN